VKTQARKRKKSQPNYTSVFPDIFKGSYLDLHLEHPKKPNYHPFMDLKNGLLMMFTSGVWEIIGGK